MRIFALLLVLLFVKSLGISQISPINFETPGIGASWTWTVFENATNPALEIVNNPSVSGINTSSKVAKFTALKAGQPYAGCESAHGTKDLGPFVLDSTNSTIKIMVWKPTISNVGIKLVSAIGWSQGELKVANTKINEWEELTFDFSGLPNPPAASGKYDQIVVFPDFTTSARSQDNVVYFDNITFNKKAATSNEPTTAAPTPTRNAADVISLFSNAYTNVPVDTWRTDWSSAILADISIAGNATKKYSALSFVGIETIAKQLDISGMTHMHIDVWSPNFTLFGIKLVDFGANGKYDAGGDDKEHLVNTTGPAKGQWVGLDIPLASFTGLTTKKNIAQLIFEVEPKGSTIVYVDNVYFYKGTETVISPVTAAPTPTRKASDVISLFSNAYTNVPVDIWRTDWSAATLEDVQIQSNATKKYSNLGFVGIETVTKQVDLTNMTHMHLDIWSPDFTFFGVKLVDFGANGKFDNGGDDKEHQVNFNAPLQGQWVALDIPIASFTGLTTRKNIAQLIFEGQPTRATTVFVDNVYFYNKPSSTNNLLSDKVKIFPNPVKSGDILKYEGEIQGFEIFDIRGMKVITSNETNSSEIQLDKGIFLMKVKTTAGETITKKLVVQ